MRTSLYIIKFLILLTILAGCKSKSMVTDASGLRNKEIKGNVKERYAEVLGVSKRELDNEKLYKFIDEWLGVPHVTGGMSKKGIDCSGFVGILEKEIYDKTLPRISRQMAENVKRKYENQLEEGDLIFFDFNGQQFSHVGVYLKNNKFVHSSTKRGIIISDLKDNWYYKYFSRAGAVKD